jgi:signal transduction histidine kinase
MNLAEPSASSPASPRSVTTGIARVGYPAFAAALTILSCFTAVHLYVLYLDRMPIDWAEAILSGFATWYPWLVLGPGVFWVAARFPLEPDHWVVSLPTHVLAGFVFGVAHGVMRAGVGPWVDSTHIPPIKIILGQMLLTVLSYWVFVAAYQSLTNYRRFRERELRASQLESRLAQAQLEVLRMQLHPHFLFNTLHAVSTLIHRDPEAADDMVSQLSDLLRMTFENIGRQEVSLREEIDFLQRYLDIQQTRFQDRLHVTLDIPSDTLDARVPNQALQPLVENAIRHGLDERTGEGAIEIAAREAGEVLTVTVRDNGPGLTPNGSAVKQEGVGLANTRARLRQLYGPDAVLEMTNHAQGGTLVTLRIPQMSPTGAQA